MKRLRWAWWAGGTLAVLLGVLAVCEAEGWPFLRGPLQRQATRLAGVPVLLDGRFELHLLGPPHVNVEGLRVGAAHGLPLPHLLLARQVSLGWRWRDLWRWRRGDVLRLQRLEAEQLDARLLRLEDGRASWQLGTPRPEDGKPVRPLEGVPHFALLQVRQGHVTVDDRPLRTQLEVDFQGGEGEATAGGRPAGYEATLAGRWRAVPLQLRVGTGTLTALQQEQARGDALQLPLRVQGRAGAAQVNFDGRVALPGAPSALQGSLHLSGPSLAEAGAPFGVTLPRTPPFDLRGVLGLHGPVWTLAAERASIGRSLLEGEFRFDTGTKPPRLQGRLGGARLLLSDLAPAVGSPPPKGKNTKPATRPARVLPQRRFDLPSLRAMDADLQVGIAELDFGSSAISSLRDLRTHLQLQEGVLQLSDLQATVAGGRFGGSTRLDSAHEPARWAADLRFDNVDLVGWLPSLRTETGRRQPPARGGTTLGQRRQAARAGGEAEVAAWLTGLLSGRVQVTGRGRSTAEILSTLDGRAQLLLRDGSMSHLAIELAGLDVAQSLGVMLKKDRPLPLRCARLDLQVQQGRVRPRVAVLDNSDSTVFIDGQIDLRDESLALRATVKPKDFSPLSLRTPIVVGGTLGAPKAGVEGERLAAKVLGALALGAAVGPAAALLPLVDPGGREKTDPCAGPAAAP